MAIFSERNLDVNIHNRLTKSIRPPLPRSKEAIDDESKMQKRERDYRNQEKTIRCNKPLPRSKEAIDDESKMQKRERDYRNQEKTIRYENEGMKVDAMGVLGCTVPWDDADTKA